MSKKKGLGECSIYCISNTINNKVYIGQTWGTIKDRFTAHCNRAGCTKIYNAIQKHGRDNFKIISICSTLNQIDADYLESHFIEIYDSIIAGYNLKTGGSHGKHSEETKIKLSQYVGRAPGNKGVSPTIEQKARLMESLSKQIHPFTGRIVSDAERRFLSETNSGENNFWFGKTGAEHPRFGAIASKETRQKMSLGLRGENNGNAKLTEIDVVNIKQMLRDGITCTEIGRMFNTTSQTISCIKHNKSWKYLK